MDLQEQDIALLEAYLSGALGGEDLRACEMRLQTEPALADLLVMMQGLEGAAAQTAKGSIKKDLKAAKSAAIAAGMASYTPSINAPKSGGNFLVRLLKFLLKLAILGALGWVIWKYVLHERWPQFGQTSSSKTETKTETKTTITRDTIRSNQRVRGEGQALPLAE